jgi:hypothetical protein
MQEKICVIQLRFSQENSQPEIIVSSAAGLAEGNPGNKGFSDKHSAAHCASDDEAAGSSAV